MTLIIIVLTCLLSIPAFSNGALMYKLIFNPYQIQQRNEYYRFLTSGFLHANWMHLIFNMLVLYWFGANVEFEFFRHFDEKGNLLYILLYLLAIVCSSIFTFFKHKDDPHYNSLGASGAVSAVVFASILFQPFADLCLYGLLCLPGILFGAAYLAYSWHMSKRGGDNINHDAHFYGAVFGIVFTIVLEPQIGLDFINKFRGLF
ncbi:MAG: rhomboid family intramembrane serine protease [Bacteroidia bacterium]